MFILTIDFIDCVSNVFKVYHKRETFLNYIKPIDKLLYF